MYGILVLSKIRKSPNLSAPSLLAIKTVEKIVINLGKMSKPNIKIMKV